MTDELPKTILYSLNPNDNAAIGTIIGCFQDAGVAGKIQQGSAWWFNDHKQGMIDQMTSLANLGLLSNFGGNADRFQKLFVLYKDMSISDGFSAISSEAG